MIMKSDKNTECSYEEYTYILRTFDTVHVVPNLIHLHTGAEMHQN